jgi:hypothetical protein
MSSVEERIKATTEAARLAPAPPFKEDLAVSAPTTRTTRRPVRSRTHRISVDLTESEYRMLRSFRTPDVGMAGILRAAVRHLSLHPELVADLQADAQEDV